MSSEFVALPFDVLLSIAILLPYSDVLALGQTCSELRQFTQTRPILRWTAQLILDGCVGLGVNGFGGGALNCLSDAELRHSVDMARKRMQWAVREPAPATRQSSSHFLNDSPSRWYNRIDVDDSLLDWVSPISSEYLLCALKDGQVLVLDVHRNRRPLAQWVPPPSLTPGVIDKWELWKCRVEFAHRKVWFVMARWLEDPSGQDEENLTQFTLVSLDLSKKGDPSAPVFTTHARFTLPGTIMNIFLLRVSGLDTSGLTLLDNPDEQSLNAHNVLRRQPKKGKVISALTWLDGPGSIGLFVLFGWRDLGSQTEEEDEEMWTWIDTGISCNPSTNFSSVLHSNHIVIHRDETGRSIQYFYPLSLLRQHGQPMPKENPIFVAPAPTWNSSPDLGTMDSAKNQPLAPTCRLVPPKTVQARLRFPPPASHRTGPGDWLALRSILDVCSVPILKDGSSSTPIIPEAAATTDSPIEDVPEHPPPYNPYRNPFRYPNWYNECAHFVRQWWPTLLIKRRIGEEDEDPWMPREEEPKLNNSVILLSETVLPANKKPKMFMILQHYFWCPLLPFSEVGDSKGFSPLNPGEFVEDDLGEDGAMPVFYTRPFRVVCIPSDKEPPQGVMLDQPMGNEEDDDEVDGGGPQGGEPPRTTDKQPQMSPLLAVDFGHAAWLEYDEESPNGTIPGSFEPGEDMVEDGKSRISLKILAFPPAPVPDNPLMQYYPNPYNGLPRKLAVPPELDLSAVESINLDQTQGTVILGVKGGQVYFLCYE